MTRPSFWRQWRHRWNAWLRALAGQSPRDLLRGVDAQGRDVHLPPAPLRARRGRPGREDLDALDREFLAGGDVTDRVARGVLRDLGSPPAN